MLDSWPGPRPVLAAAELALLPALAPPAASEMEERLPRVALVLCACADIPLPTGARAPPDPRGTQLRTSNALYGEPS